MTISIWRYSHFALAVSSFLFLALASITGIILAFEPIANKTQPYRVAGFDTLTVAQVVPALKDKYPGLQEIKVDDNEHVIITWSGKEGDNQKAYVHPLTGQQLGKPQEKPALFQFTTNLHRSLFLHETGRIIMGLTSFLLILIALSGIALVIQRQKGWKRFFNPIERTNWAQYYHVLFGRLALLPILFVAITGTLLALAVLDHFAPTKTALQVNTDNVAEEPLRKPGAFPLFQSTPLAAVQNIALPFSEFPEDYYTLKLNDRQVAVNQFTGDVLAQQTYSRNQRLNSWAMRWHTGRNYMAWAIVLAVTAGYMLFFIYSGLVITVKRRSGRLKNRFSANDAHIVILVGTENGTTYRFAASVCKQLLAHGQKVFLTEPDKYMTYPQAKHLIVMTSTYGLGDPPTNAKHFAARLLKMAQPQNIQYSVVGFGSRSYPQFCQFAVEVDHLLQQQSWAQPATALFTVDDRSPQDFSNWVTAWSAHTGLPLTLTRDLLVTNKHGLEKLTVTHKTAIDENDAFRIKLKIRNRKVTSGDLLAVYPKGDHRERLYSIGKLGSEIQLSVKVYEKGLGSRYLLNLSPGEKIRARIIKNQHFHFPRKAPAVVMIANGTGIAPFLGMIHDNRRKTPIELYCGFRTSAAFTLYKDLLDESKQVGKLNQVYLALSREGTKQYVSTILNDHRESIYQHLVQGTVFMICGSLSMQQDVLKLLDGICREQGDQFLEAYQQAGQILTDCY